MQQKSFPDARDAYEQALTVNPRSAQANAALGYVYTQLGDQQSALQAYEQAVELSPRNFTNRKNLAIIYEQLGMVAEAISQTTVALELAPDDQQKETMTTFLAQLERQQSAPSPEAAQQAQELLVIAQAHMEAEAWISAEMVFSQALALDPTNAQAHSALAYVYAKEGRVDEAISENLVTIDLAPTDYNSHKNLAILYQQQGDLGKALAQAEQALALAPEAEKEVLQTFVDRLKQVTGGSGSGSQAGDVPPAQRNDMYSAPPPMSIDPNKSYQATFVTAKGNIVVDLDAKAAPQTVNNFVYLAREGFYDGLTFHRVESQAGFSLIQGGDPLGTGTGGPGYTVPAEIGLEHNQGAIAMARQGDTVNPERASSGSQFYICLVPIHQLDGAYTVFGYVSQGLDVAQTIAVGDVITAITITEK